MTDQHSSHGSGRGWEYGPIIDWEEDPETGCWNWSGTVVPATGYGNVMFHKRQWKPHRLIYMWERGDIPDGLQIDHLCRNKICVNPDHLEAVTAQVNSLRSESPMAHQARQTHCKRGHPFDEENTIRRADGSRNCRACQTLRWKRAYEQKKARK